MKLISLATLFLIALTLPSISALAADIDDGAYDAQVTTSSGTYTVPVEVEDGAVTHVQWPNGGNMHIHGGELDDGEASGYDLDGDQVLIEVEYPNNDV